jgi:hypothetical protein
MKEKKKLPGWLQDHIYMMIIVGAGLVLFLLSAFFCFPSGSGLGCKDGMLRDWLHHNQWFDWIYIPLLIICYVIIRIGTR